MAGAVEGTGLTQVLRLLQTKKPPVSAGGFLFEGERCPQESSGRFSDIEVCHRERIVLDEFAPRLNLVAHEA